MRRIGAELLAALRDVWTITFVEPVREGRPRPRTWPDGLAAIGAATLVLYALLTLAATFAVPLRQAGELSASPASDQTLPTVVVPVLLVGLIFSFSLAHTAALHTSWWLRIALFLVGATATIFFVAPAFNNPVLVLGSLGSYAALLVFTLLRARRQYAWWEFLVVTWLVGVAMLSPWLGDGYAVLDADLRPVSIIGTLTSLQLLAVPAIVVAGAAPAQIVVTAAEATASRPVGRVLFWTGAAVVTLWFTVSTVVDLTGGGLAPEALAGGLVAVLVTAALLATVLRLAGRAVPDAPEAYPAPWSAWLYPLATAMAGLTLLIVPLATLRALLPLFGFGQGGLAEGFDALWYGFLDGNTGAVWRGLIGLAALGFAWRASRAGRLAEAGVLVAFAAAVGLDAFGLLASAGFLHDRTPQAIGVLAGLAALTAGLVMALRRTLTRRRAVGVLTVLLLAVLYPHRGVLADPASAVLVFSAPMVILFGLTWRALTDAQFTRTGSRHFPQPTRVLLFLANSLFAVTNVAFVALARATGTQFDTASWAELGADQLGDPLFVVSIVAATWLVLARPQYTREPSSTSAPASDSTKSATVTGLENIG